MLHKHKYHDRLEDCMVIGLTVYHRPSRTWLHLHQYLYRDLDPDNLRRDVDRLSWIMLQERFERRDR